MKLSLYIFLFSVSILACGQSSTLEIQYSEHENIIANPERGFYQHTEVHTDSYGNLNKETLEGYRVNQSITQILRVFYLEAFRNRPITEDFLNNMQIDFAAARQAGIKVIVRFAYSQGTSAPYNDAQPDIVFMHIQQLKDVLRQNADVIAVMQAGFVGTWGEWYYTEGFAGNGPSDISPQNYADRAQVIAELLNVLPKDRMVQIRTPGYKMRIYDTEEPINTQEGHSGTNRARLGHHNDCFVASSSDFGTYRDQDLEKPYLEAETTYLPMGGETCAVAPPYSDCDNSTSELERFHWSYLNIAYNRDVLDVWRNQGCFDEVELRLGYRYVLNSSSITSSVKPNSSFSFNLNLINKGYASPYNPRDVIVILKNKVTNEEYAYQVDEDPRFWPIGSDFSIQFTTGLPADIAEGDYQVYLKLGDPYPTLSDNPSFSIQTANEDTWDSVLGYNNLNLTLKVDNDNPSETYMGDEYFKLTGVRQTEELPTQLYAGASSSERVLFWGPFAGFSRVIERSVNDSEFSVIKTLDGSIKFFKDAEFVEGANYSYRFKLRNNTVESEYSNTFMLNNAANDKIEINLDGSDSDWKNSSTLISSVSAEQETFVIRTFFDASKVNFMIYGSISDYEIYLNTDNDLETGWESSDVKAGMDYLVQDEKVFLLGGQSQTEKLTIQNFIKTNTTVEFSFDLSTFENLGINPIIGLYGVLNGSEELGVDEGSSAERFFRQPQPDLPDSIYTKNPVNDKTSTELIWGPCEFCDGYEIERSTDNITFSNVADVDYTSTNLIDRGLTIDQKYYYRIRSYNILGYSEYSSVISTIAGSQPLTLTSNSKIEIYPNPAHEWINLTRTYDEISVVDLIGNRMIQQKSPTNKDVDISGLKNGVYLFVGKKEDQYWTGRFLKK